MTNGNIHQALSAQPDYGDIGFPADMFKVPRPTTGQTFASFVVSTELEPKTVSGPTSQPIGEAVGVPSDIRFDA